MEKLADNSEALMELLTVKVRYQNDCKIVMDSEIQLAMSLSVLLPPSTDIGDAYFDVRCTNQMLEFSIQPKGLVTQEAELISCLREKFKEGLQQGTIWQILETIQDFFSEDSEMLEHLMIFQREGQVNLTQESIIIRLYLQLCFKLSPFRGLSNFRATTEFEIKERLGKGGFGKVFKCISLLDNMTYAIKQIPFVDSEGERAIREVKLLCTMNHPNVIRYYQSWIEDAVRDLGSSDSGEGSSSGEELPSKSLYIIMEFCPETLEQRIKGGVLDPSMAWKFVRQIAAGLKYIHDCGIIHRDISRANIFVDGSDDIKIGDFGLATYYDPHAGGTRLSTSAGNATYRAPEMQPGKMISPMVDIFAFGLVAIELLYKMDTDQERANIFDNARKGIFPADFPEDENTARWLLSFLRHEATRRPSAEAILKRLIT